MTIFRTQRPIEERLSATEWLEYQSNMLAPDGAMTYEQEVNAEYLTAAIRAAIRKGQSMSTQAKKQFANDHAREGLDLHFSNSSANKAKLRWRKYKPSFNIAHLRNEMAHFIASGCALQHIRHLTQDAKPPAKRVMA